MMGSRPLAGCALGAHVSPRRVGQRAPRAATKGRTEKAQLELTARGGDHLRGHGRARDGGSDTFFAQKWARRQTENAGSTGRPIRSSWLQPRPTLPPEKCAAWAWRDIYPHGETFIHTTRYPLVRSARAARSSALQPTFRGDWPPQSTVTAARRAHTRTRNTKLRPARSHAGRLDGACAAEQTDRSSSLGRGKAPDMPVAGGCPARHAPYPRWRGWRRVPAKPSGLQPADLIL